MIWVLTVVGRGKTTRRRRGSAETVVIDTDVEPAYRGLTQPVEIERRYLELTNPHLKAEEMTVVDVRTSDHESERQRRAPVNE